jgi:hypothetical protein
MDMGILPTHLRMYKDDIVSRVKMRIPLPTSGNNGVTFPRPADASGGLLPIGLSPMISVIRSSSRVLSERQFHTSMIKSDSESMAGATFTLLSEPLKRFIKIPTIHEAKAQGWTSR